MTTAVTGPNGVSDRVLHALQNDPRTMEAVIDVSYQQGAVTLSGRVPTHEMREAAFEIARKQEGVITVINDLKV